jgi:hypothetical protein
MNHPAEALFGSLHNGLLSWTKTLASRIRELVGADKLSVNQHEELEATIQTELESLASYFFGRFDNVGCSLPPGVLGYDIIAKLSAEREGQIIRLHPVPIREAEHDYAIMWYDFLAENRRDTTKKGDSPKSS